MLPLGLLLLAVLGASVRGLRTDGPRWPFLLSTALSGSALLALVVATLVALTVGRDTWSSWVSGSATSEAVTLWVVLVVGPVLLATCLALLVTGAILRGRHRRDPGRVPAR